jgi:tetrahydromethanopterin S-methyltransferase subunit C
MGNNETPTIRKGFKMSNLEIAKKITSIVVGMGTGSISAHIIKNNVPMESVIQKITVPSAAIVIGMMASEATEKYTDAKIDKIVAAFKSAKTKIDEAQKDQK